MRTETIVLGFLVCLGAPMLARAQNNDDWPSLSYLRSDYRRVAVVAHVRVREAEIVKTIGGYEDWRLVGEVIEPFKGKFRKGQTVEFYHGAEKGFRKEIFLGEKIVFLLRNFVQEEKRWVYAVLENSTLPFNEDRVVKLRKIMRSTRAVTRPSGRAFYAGSLTPSLTVGIDILDASSCLSPRSGRQRKAWA